MIIVHHIISKENFRVWGFSVNMERIHFYKSKDKGVRNTVRDNN